MAVKPSIPVDRQKIKLRIKRIIFYFSITFISFLTVISLALSVFLWQVFGIDLAKLPRLTRLFFSRPENVLLSQNNRTNYLILGIAGGEYDGSDLTDTMIFLSVDRDGGDTVIMSVPRDIWVPELVTKINAVWHYGQKGNNNGFDSLNQVFNSLFGQPVHYFVLLEFDTFTKLIDVVGGIDVEVERAFDDFKYPIAGKEDDKCNGDPEYHCRYEALHFERGWQTMSGERALKYVRSRNAEGEEGTDFARSLRQQKVMLALKDKLLRLNILASAGKVRQIYQTIMSDIVVYPTMGESELMGTFRLGLKFLTKQAGFRTLTLEIGSDDDPGFLVNTPPEKYGQWVLEPPDGDWSRIKEFVQEKLAGRY